MAKTLTKSNNHENPFLTEKPNSLWKKLHENSKRVTKEELLKRVKKLKSER